MFVGVEFFTAPRIQAVTPRADAFLKDAATTVSIKLDGAQGLGDLYVRLDGADITPNVHTDGDRLYFETGRLPDGEHTVVLRASTGNLLWPRVGKTWSFIVDTQPPTMVLDKPARGAAVTTAPVLIQGRTEPNAVISASIVPSQRHAPSAEEIARRQGIKVLPATPSPKPSPAVTPLPSGSYSPTTGPTSPSPSTPPAVSSPSPSPSATITPTTSARVVADAQGRFSIPLELPDGPSKAVLVATDGAGNTAQASTSFVVDVLPPELLVGGIGRTVRESKPHITIVASDQAGRTNVRARLDGTVVYDGVLDGQAALPAAVLAEGTHTLVVTATDRGRNATTDNRTFLVDSTDKLGDATLIMGAKGRDVRALQKLLKAQDYFVGQPTGVYDKRTARAVTRFQEHLGMEADGVAGERVLAALRGRIVIDQSEHKLYFYLGNKLKRVYRVATGQPAYPTPNGTFYVVWMTRNPTWTPPDSPWAAGAKPIAPGPNNPVGLRWIGTSYPGVGIHGVPPSENGSIGTYASHGCIRMYEWEVEQLYEMVAVGMPVIIRP